MSQYWILVCQSCLFFTTAFNSTDIKAWWMVVVVMVINMLSFCLGSGGGNSGNMYPKYYNESAEGTSTPCDCFEMTAE